MKKLKRKKKTTIGSLNFEDPIFLISGTDT